MPVLNSLTRDKVLTVLCRYVKDERNHQTVLLNGEWGCGKTHFIENDFFPKVQEMNAEQNKEERTDDIWDGIWNTDGDSQDGKKPPKRYLTARVSLYGLDSREQIESSIDEAFRSDMEKFFRNAAKVLGPVLREATKKLWSFDSDKTEYAVSAGTEEVQSFIRQEKNLVRVLALDDFERSTMNYAELLGIINNYAENKRYKVILLADESKMSFEDGKMSDLALQYAVALNPGLWLHDYQGTISDEHRIFNMDQLKERKELLFPADKIYQETKEKVICFSITFRPDFNADMDKIIGDSLGPDCPEDCRDVRVFIANHKESFKEPFSKYGIHNLRTVIAALSAADNLLRPIIWNLHKKYDDINLSEEKKQDIAARKRCYEAHAEKCLKYVAYAQIRKSMGCPSQDWSRSDTYQEKLSYERLPEKESGPDGRVYAYKFVDDYLETGYCSDEEIMRVIGNTLPQEIAHQREQDYKNLALFRLNEGRWACMEDDEVIKAVKEILPELREGKYFPYDFRDIIQTLMEILHADLWKVKFEASESNVSEPDLNEYVAAMTAYFQTEEKKPKRNPEKRVIKAEWLSANNLQSSFASEYADYMKPLIPYAEAYEEQQAQQERLKPDKPTIADRIRNAKWDETFLSFLSRKFISDCTILDLCVVRREFLAYWKPDDLTQRLEQSTPREIANFTDILSSVYNEAFRLGDAYKNPFRKDKAILPDLLERIEQTIQQTIQDNSRCTRRIQLLKLKETLETYQCLLFNDSQS